MFTCYVTTCSCILVGLLVYTTRQWCEVIRLFQIGLVTAQCATEGSHTLIARIQPLVGGICHRCHVHVPFFFNFLFFLKKNATQTCGPRSDHEHVWAGEWCISRCGHIALSCWCTHTCNPHHHTLMVISDVTNTDKTRAHHHLT